MAELYVIGPTQPIEKCSPTIIFNIFQDNKKVELYTWKEGYIIVDPVFKGSITCTEQMYIDQLYVLYI